MANDFLDSRIVDYWLFANNLTAAKAGNDLTASAGGVGYEENFPAAGEYGLALAAASDQWASRADADLSAGFPLKSGDTVKKASWAAWIRPATIGGPLGAQYIIAKYTIATNGRSLALRTLSSPSNTLSIMWGYGSTSFVDWQLSGIIAAGNLYHIGLAVDGVNRTALVRVYDAGTETATTYTKTDWGQDLNVTTAPFVIGTATDRTDLDYNGTIGGVVVANDLFTADEFDEIRNRTFTDAKNIDSMVVQPVMSHILAPSRSPSQACIVAM